MRFSEYKQAKFDALLESGETANKIDEAFSEANLRKVGELLASLAGKKLGGQFTYLFSETFKKSNGQKGQGAVFVSTQGVILRFNYLSTVRGSYTVNAIDYWKGRKLGDTPNISLTFEPDTNIVEIQDTVWKTILAGKLVESADDMNEDAKADREAFAAKHGIKPSYAGTNYNLKKQAAKLGLEKEFEEEFGSGSIEVEKNVGESTSSQKKWKEDEKKFQNEEIFADPEFVFQDMEEAAKVVARGKWRSLIIAGMGGIGKSYGVKQVLTKELGPYGEGPDGKWAFYEGLKTTGFGLYKLLLLNKNKLVVFDDSDSIWGDKDIINMMKIVTSDSGERRISWSSGAVAQTALMTREEREQYEMDYIAELMEDPNTKMKAPSSFNFTGQMINISNMKPEKFDDAIKSRAIFINVYLAQRDVIRRMYTIKKMQGIDDKTIRFLLKALVPDAEDALSGIGAYGGEVRYMTPEDARKNKILNMRSLDIAQSLYEAGVKNFEHMVGLYA